MISWLYSLQQQIRQRLTLQVRLALWSAGLSFSLSLVVVLFTNVIMTLLPPPSTVAILGPALEGENALPGTSPPPAVLMTQPSLQAGILAQTQMLLQMRWISLIGLGLALALSGMGAYWLAGYALRPVREISQAIRRINASTLDTRLALNGPPDELKQLADAFNFMLDRLEHAFVQQSRFVADAAHELRTPLAILRANVEMALESANATLDDYREMNAALERALTRLERVVADLLLLAQAEEEIVRTREEVSLEPLLEEVLLDLKPLADERQVTLRLTGETETVVHGNALLLARAFSNLIENGIRYNHPGGKVVITTYNDNACAIVTVADTGSGIAPEDQPHIFDRFYRVERSRSRHLGGAGLGLSIVAHIVQLHGGQVQVESIPGVGSTFTVRLPL